MRKCRDDGNTRFRNTALTAKEKKQPMLQQQNHTIAQFNGVKVFSATMAQERENLGEKVTVWVREHPQCKVVDTVVTQSSDEAFHCLAITVFYMDEKA
jgi:hypothetical protein